MSLIMLNLNDQFPLPFDYELNVIHVFSADRIDTLIIMVWFYLIITKLVIDNSLGVFLSLKSTNSILVYQT